MGLIFYWLVVECVVLMRMGDGMEEAEAAEVLRMFGEINSSGQIAYERTDSVSRRFQPLV